MLTETDVVLRFIIAAIVGLLIGFSRRKKPAGIRTFALICLGSTIFTVVSISDAVDSLDKGRIIAQIVAGVGFIGLGVIWRSRNDKPSGLTTAAGIWVTAAVGVLIGLGLWVEVIAGSILTLLILLSKDPLKKTGIDPS